MKNALSSNTQRTYSSAQKQFISFCEKNNFLQQNGSPCPASELTVLRFLGKISATCQASSAKVYLAAVRSLHISQGYNDPFVNLPRIPLVVRGLRRAKSFEPKAPKLPITALVLHTVKMQLDLSNFNDIMFWAACCCAFFGFLRAAEFIPPSSGFSSRIHLSSDSITIDKSPVPDKVFLQLRYSKTDQFGKGYTVVLARADSALCPVTALMTFMRLRGSRAGPLFIHADGSFLTRQKLNTRLQQLLAAAGWNGRCTLHSFLIGAASTAASLGFPDYLIKALGRWSSEAYQVYIKLPQHRLVSASRCLSVASNFATS